jgi:hypothetical protein
MIGPCIYHTYRTAALSSSQVSRMPSATRRDGSAIGASASTATAQQQQQQQLEQAVQQLHGKLSENGMGGTGEGSTPVRRTPLHHHEPQFEPEHIVHHGSSPYSIDANGKRVFHARKNSGNKSPKSPPGNKVGSMLHNTWDTSSGQLLYMWIPGCCSSLRARQQGGWVSGRLAGACMLAWLCCGCCNSCSEAPSETGSGRDTIRNQGQQLQTSRM